MNEQPRETGNIWYARRRQNKAKTQHHMSWIANTNNVNKTRAFIQINGGNRNGHHNTEFRT